MSEDPFTIEKLKLNDRLHAVELQVARLVSHMESERGTLGRATDLINKTFDRVMVMIEKHDSIIIGNGNGIVTKVDRLEIAESSRQWHLRAIWTSIIAVFMKVLYDLFAKP